MRNWDASSVNFKANIQHCHSIQKTKKFNQNPDKSFQSNMLLVFDLKFFRQMQLFYDCKKLQTAQKHKFKYNIALIHYYYYFLFANWRRLSPSTEQSNKLHETQLVYKAVKTKIRSSLVNLNLESFALA